MKLVKILAENWFKNAPFHEVKMVGIKHLGIPAEKFENKQPEGFKRALVRQTFNAGHEYGEEFEIIEPPNPFGTPGKRKTGSENYEYSFVRNGLRLPHTDFRWEMLAVIARNTSWKDAVADWETDHKPNERYVKPTEKKTTVSFKEQIAFALKQGWIIKTGE
jgi:hypothetical protein